MKYIKDFESINENKKNAKRFTNKGKLGYNDQFSGNIALSKTLSDEFGFDPKKEFSQGVGFDSTTMYDVKSGKTIIEDALAGKHTYDDLVKLGKEWYSKNESVDENAKSDAKEIFDELMDVNGEEIADMDSQEAMTILSRRGIRGGKANMIAKELLKMTSSIGESLTEAKKFKPGDMWSNDFDYDGMMKYALTVNHKTPIKTLTKLHDSATDVNYHTPFRGLGNAIDWITDDGVNSPEGKDFIKQFHKDIKDEIKRMK